MDTDFISISNEIKTELKRQRIPIGEAAEICGKTLNAFSALLSGKKISGKTALLLQEKFGMNAAYIMTGKGSIRGDQQEQPAEVKAEGKGITIPAELAQMFADMAATIRSQQEQLRELQKK